MTHGTNNSYQNHNCRCVPCKDAHAKWYREKAARLRKNRSVCEHKRWVGHQVDRVICLGCMKTAFVEPKTMRGYRLPVGAVVA